MKASSSLIHTLWGLSRPESGLIKEIVDSVNQVRGSVVDVDPVLTPDAIVFAYIISAMLRHFVSKEVVQGQHEKLCEILNELAEIITELDGSSWTQCRRKCVEMTCIYLRGRGLSNNNLRIKLKAIGGTWNSRWCY